jgi:hypothetical protein
VTFWRLWQRASSARAGGIIELEEFASRKKKVGRMPIYCKATVRDEVGSTPLVNKLSAVIRVSKTMVS